MSIRSNYVYEYIVSPAAILVPYQVPGTTVVVHTGTVQIYRITAKPVLTYSTNAAVGGTGTFFVDVCFALIAIATTTAIKSASVPPFPMCRKHPRKVPEGLLLKKTHTCLHCWLVRLLAIQAVSAFHTAPGTAVL